MARITRHTGGAGCSRLLSLPMVAAAFLGCHLLAVEARAHVRVPNYSHLDRKMESGNQGAATTARLERPGANDHGSAKLRTGCDASLSAIRLSADATLAAIVLGSPPLRLFEVRLDSGAPTVRLPGGAFHSRRLQPVRRTSFRWSKACPLMVCPVRLYISVGRDGFKHIFWRFAPVDEPAGWFDEEGRRLGMQLLRSRSRAHAFHRRSGRDATTVAYREAAFTMALITSRTSVSRFLRQPTA